MFGLFSKAAATAIRYVSPQLSDDISDDNFHYNDDSNDKNVDPTTFLVVIAIIGAGAALLSCAYCVYRYLENHAEQEEAHEQRRGYATMIPQRQPSV